MAPRRDGDGRQFLRHDSQNGSHQQDTNSNDHAKYTPIQTVAATARAAHDLLRLEVAEREAACRPTRRLVKLLPVMAFVRDELDTVVRQEGGAA